MSSVALEHADAVRRAGWADCVRQYVAEARAALNDLVRERPLTRSERLAVASRVEAALEAALISVSDDEDDSDAE